MTIKKTENKPQKNITKKQNEKERIVGMIIEVLKDGGSITEACRIAGIHRDTFYDWKNKDKDFSDKVEYAENYMNEIAKGVIVRSIKEWSSKDAKWWLERKAKNEFSTRSEITGKDGENITAVNFVITPIKNK